MKFLGTLTVGVWADGDDLHAVPSVSCADAPRLTTPQMERAEQLRRCAAIAAADLFGYAASPDDGILRRAVPFAGPDQVLGGGVLLRPL